MKKVDSLILKFFLYGLPVLIGYAFFAHWYNPDFAARAARAAGTGYLETLYDLGGIIFGAWMILAIYLSIRLMLSGQFREEILSKLTLIKERDEREVLLTGKAAKTTVLTSLAILIFLFCLSCFQVAIYRVPPEQAVDGKTRVISLGVGFGLLASDRPENSAGTANRKDILSYTGLPVSSSTVILGLIVWQIAAYNYTMRHLMK